MWLELVMRCQKKNTEMMHHAWVLLTGGLHHNFLLHEVPNSIKKITYYSTKAHRIPITKIDKFREIICVYCLRKIQRL